MGKSNVNSKNRPRLSRPGPIKAGHAIKHFDCGEHVLTKWLREDAYKANSTGTAKTIVVCRGTKRVVAYCSLAAGSVEHEIAPGALRRNAPDPIPIILLARLAVDLTEQGNGIGQSLLAEGFKRALMASKYIGARAVICHALNKSVVKYYEDLGFRKFPDHPQTLFIPMKTIETSLD